MHRLVVLGLPTFQSCIVKKEETVKRKTALVVFLAGTGVAGAVLAVDHQIYGSGCVENFTSTPSIT